MVETYTGLQASLFDLIVEGRLGHCGMGQVVLCSGNASHNPKVSTLNQHNICIHKFVIFMLFLYLKILPFSIKLQNVSHHEMFLFWSDMITVLLCTVNSVTL